MQKSIIGRVTLLRSLDIACRVGARLQAAILQALQVEDVGRGSMEWGVIHYHLIPLCEGDVNESQLNFDFQVSLV